MVTGGHFSATVVVLWALGCHCDHSDATVVVTFVPLRWYCGHCDATVVSFDHCDDTLVNFEHCGHCGVTVAATLIIVIVLSCTLAQL